MDESARVIYRTYQNFMEMKQCIETMYLSGLRYLERAEEVKDEKCLSMTVSRTD
jgi:hypothetical protein